MTSDLVLEEVRRHVAAAEQRVAAQRRLLAELEQANEDTSAAHDVLQMLQSTLATMRQHLAFEERGAERAQSSCLKPTRD
jgi:hypothetical protein